MMENHYGNGKRTGISLEFCIAMEKWNAPPESVSIIEYNLSFDKSNWFSVSQEEMKCESQNLTLQTVSSLVTSSCNRVSLRSLLNTIFHIEINKNGWENFIALLERGSGLL
jgi:hypothetical protein